MPTAADGTKTKKMILENKREVGRRRVGFKGRPAVRPSGSTLPFPLTESRRATHGSKFGVRLQAGKVEKEKKRRRGAGGGAGSPAKRRRTTDDDDLPASQPAFWAFSEGLTRPFFNMIASCDTRPHIAKLFLNSHHQELL